MPIQKGSRAAHERALKAAETRRRNRASGTYNALRGDDELPAYGKSAPKSAYNPPAFPKSYHATPTRHVTRDLKMKEAKKPARKRHTVPAPRSAKAVRAMSNAELAKAYHYWWEGIGRDRSIPEPARMGGELPYTIRDEYQKRAAATHGELPRIKAHRARRGVKKQRGSK